MSKFMIFCHIWKQAGKEKTQATVYSEESESTFLISDITAL